LCGNADMNDWDDIRFFLAVARTGTISGAARELKVNHSTVSRRVQGLEDKHGVRLFSRQRDGYELTEAGYSILEQAEAVEFQSQQISRTLFGQDSRLEGNVNLTMPHDIFEHCLADKLAEFCQLYPGIKLNLMVSKGVRNLASREADLAIRLSPSPPEYLIGKRVARMQHAIYVPVGFSGEGSVPLVVWAGETEIPDWAEAVFQQCHIALRVDDLTSMYAAVVAGFGVARMPCYLPDSVKDPAVFKLATSLPPSDWALWVLNHVDLRKTARVQACKRFLIEVLEERKSLFQGEAH